MNIKSLTLFGLIPFLFGCNVSLSKEIIMPNSKKCKSREECPSLFTHLRCVRVQNTLFETKVIGSHIHSFYDPD